MKRRMSSILKNPHAFPVKTDLVVFKTSYDLKTQ